MSAKKHILTFDDDFTNDFYSIAIHSSIDDYKLAFHLNKNMPFQLARKKNNVVYFLENEKNNPRHYYSFQDNKEFITYYLIENKNLYNNDFINLGLFTDTSFTAESYFSKAFAKVDYFLILKGEDIENKTKDILNILKNIDTINSSYLINLKKLKTTNYLLLN